MKTFGLFSLMILLLCALSCTSTDRMEEESPRTLPPPASVTVKTAVVETRNMAEEIRCEGRVVSQHKRIISTPVSGRISRLNLQPGGVLRPGDLLFQLDTTFLNMSLEEALLEREEAAIRLEEKLSSRPDRDTLPESVLRRWELICGIPQSNQKVRRARKELLGATGRATDGGRVGTVFVWEGQSVTVGEKIAEYHPSGSFEIELKLSDLPADLAPGKKALIQFHQDSASLTGVIHSILPQVNEQGLFVVYVRLTNPNCRLYQGQRVSGLIMEDLGEDVPVVPVEALTTRSGRSVVFRVRQEQAEWAYVTTGRQVAGHVQVLDGLEIGDTVITSGQQYLGHHSSITFDDGTDGD